MYNKVRYTLKTQRGGTKVVIKPPAKRGTPGGTTGKIERRVISPYEAKEIDRKLTAAAREQVAREQEAREEAREAAAAAREAAAIDLIEQPANEQVRALPDYALIAAALSAARAPVIGAGAINITAALDAFVRDYYEREFESNEKKEMLGVADFIHDFYRGFRNKKDPSGKAESIAYLDGYLENMRLRYARNAYALHLVDLLSRNRANIEHFIRWWFENESGLSWMSPTEDAAKMTYDDFFETCSNEDDAERFAQDCRIKYSSFQLREDKLSASSFSDNQKNIICAFYITFFFGSKDAPWYAIADAAPKFPGKIVKRNTTGRLIKSAQEPTDASDTLTAGYTFTTQPPLYYFVSDADNPDVFTSNSNDMTKKLGFTIKFVKNGEYSDKTPYDWDFRIEKGPVGGGLPTSTVNIKYGPNITSGPSVDQLLELQLLIRNTPGVYPAIVENFRAQKRTQLSLGAFLGPIYYDVKVGIDTNTGCLLKDIKRGGDQDAAAAVRKARRILGNVMFISGDPTACVASHAQGNPTWYHNNKELTGTICRLTEQALTEEQRAEYAFKKELNDIDAKLNMVHFFLSGTNRTYLDSLRVFFDSIRTPYTSLKNFKIDDILAYIEPIRAIDMSAIVRGNILNEILGIVGTKIQIVQIYETKIAQLKLFVWRNEYRKKTKLNTERGIVRKIKGFSVMSALYERQLTLAAASAAADPIATARGIIRGVASEIIAVIAAIPDAISQSFLSKIMKLSTDIRDLSRTRKIPELNFNPSDLSDLSEVYAKIIAPYGDRSAPTQLYELTNGENGYNKILRKICNGFYNQVEGSRLYSFFRIAVGAAPNRADLLYGNDGPAADDEEDNDNNADLETITDPGTLATIQAFEASFDSLLRDRRNEALKGAYNMQRATLVGIMHLPVGVDGIIPLAQVGGMRDGPSDIFIKGRLRTRDDNQDFLDNTVLVFLSKVAKDVNSALSIAFPFLHLKYLLNDYIYESGRLPLAILQLKVQSIIAKLPTDGVATTAADVILRDRLAASALTRAAITEMIPTLNDVDVSILYKIAVIRTTLVALSVDIQAYDLILELIRLIQINIDTTFIGILPTIAELCTVDYIDLLRTFWKDISTPYKSVEINVIDIQADIIQFIADFIDPTTIEIVAGEPSPDNARFQRYCARIASLALMYDMIRQNPSDYSYFAYLNPPVVLRQLDLVTRMERLPEMLRNISLGAQNLRLNEVVAALNPVLGGSRKSRRRRDKIRHHSTRRRK